MKVFDQYINVEPITVRGSYGDVVAVIPSGTRGCINRVPTKKYPDPCFEVMHEGQWYSACVKRESLEAQKGNAEVQRLMALCPVIQRCLVHTDFNIRPEVGAVHGALSHFFSQVYDLRFLPGPEMRRALGALRQDTSFRERIEQWYGGKRDDHWSRVRHQVSLGHQENLLRTLDQFIATGALPTRLCWFLLSHQYEELVMRDRATPCPETAAEMVHRVAREQSAALVAQEKTQASPYPLLYAAYMVYELVQKELFQAWYDYQDISYGEQERIVKEALVAAGYS